MTSLTAIGFDIGSQKTMIVAEDGEIIRTSTGSVSRPTLVSFAGKHRLFGEEAQAQISSDATIPLLNLMVGRSSTEISTMPCFSHLKLKLSEDGQGRLMTTVNYQGNEENVHVTSLFAMYFVHLYEQVAKSYGDNAVVCFPLHPNSSATVARAFKEAAVIAGIEPSKVFLADAADALVSTYARKITGLGGAEKNNLIGKNVLLVDMGHTQSTVVAVRYTDAKSTLPEKIAVAYDENLGSYHFDLKLFSHFAGICETKNKTKISPNSRQGSRLLAGCERIRKLLSQLSESQITVERLIEDNDAHFSLKRDEMYHLCSDLLDRFKGLITSTLAKLGENPVVDAVEVVGGGVRMPVVQLAINQLVGESVPLGAKLDDGSVALGAALIYRKQQNDILQAIEALKAKLPPPPATKEGDSEAKEGEVPPVPMEVDSAEDVSSTKSVSFPEIKISESDGIGLSAEEIGQAKERELLFQSKDNVIFQLHAAHNQLESYILEMRNAPRRKFGELINSQELNRILDDAETWLWDNSETTDLSVFQAKYSEVTSQVQTLCAAFFEKVNEEKLAVEKMLNEEAEKAAQEKAANGEEDEDHDSRKLKKTDRMRLVVKNKDEGTELFKGGNFRMAAARYHKALSHSTKFFDLSPEDEIEVKNLKISLYNNLATCYLKLENYDQLLNNTKEVLKLDETNVKALFRYSQYYEWKKDHEKCLEYLLLCQKYNTQGEDKLVTKSIEKTRKEIQKQKDKEKKMWGKAFA